MASRNRLPIGQLLVRMLREFRVELFRRMRELGYQDLREPHMQVFGNIRAGGSRLSELAASANMTAPAMSELVDDLQAKGYLERRPDPSDGRAKLICLTLAGKDIVRAALRNVRDMEKEYAASVGGERFESTCRTLHELLEDLVDRERSGPPALRSSR